jgi:hypothetical protein
LNLMPSEGWLREFESPIAIDGGRTLLTLKDAGEYVAALPAKVSAQDHWQTAVRELLISAERGGIILLAEWAMRRAISHQGQEAVSEPRRGRARATK